MEVKMIMNGADMLIKSLEEQGTKVVFGYPGGAVLDIYNSLHLQNNIRHILASHEQGAAHAADGYARATGETGVVLATSGPGATNLVTGLATAYLDSIPVVAVTGNVSRSLQGRDSFQEVDITGVTVPVTKHNFFIRDVNTIPQVVKRAFEIANSNRPGPVLIDMPKDIMIAMADYHPAGKFEKRENPEPEAYQLTEITQLLEKKTRPLILIGGGVRASQSGKEVLKFAQKIDGLIATTTMGLTSVDSADPRYLGVVGMHGTIGANYAVNSADIIFAVGTRFSDRVVGNPKKFAPNAKIVHIDVDDSEINKNLDVKHYIHGDCKVILPQLTQIASQKDNEQWKTEVATYTKENPLPYQKPNYGADPKKIIEKVAELTKREAVIVTDVGQHQMLVAQNYPFKNEKTFLSSLGLGTMGYGMGAANGAQVANPDLPVVLFTGDGSFHMNFAELAPAVTEGLPVIVIIFNNSVLGMVHQWQHRFYAKSSDTSISDRKTDFVKLAEAMGAKGYRVENDDDIEQAILNALENRETPTIVDCVVDCRYEIYPFIPAGKSFNDMIIEKD